MVFRRCNATYPSSHHVQALSLMWPELLEPINGAVTPSSVRFRMTLRAGNGESVVSVDDIARMDMKHLHATMFTHLRELHSLICACAGAGHERLQRAQKTYIGSGTAHVCELHVCDRCVAAWLQHMQCGLRARMSCMWSAVLWQRCYRTARLSCRAKLR